MDDPFDFDDPDFSDLYEEAERCGGEFGKYRLRRDLKEELKPSAWYSRLEAAERNFGRIEALYPKS